MTLLLLHFPPQHYYPPAAPPPVTANVFESEHLWGNNALRPVAAWKKEEKCTFFFIFFAYPDTNDTRRV